MAKIDWFVGVKGLNERFITPVSVDPQVVDGADGDDFIWTAFGYDLDYGGLGNDLIFGDGRGDTIYGDASADPSEPGGNDFILGDTDPNKNVPAFQGQDVIFGGAGNDFANGEGNNDFVDGGTGNDTLWGGQGLDQLFGGDGDDSLWGGSSPIRPSEFTVNFTTDGITGLPLIGSQSSDGGLLATDDPSIDHLFGGSGNDALHGQLGNDVLYGGRGLDHYHFDTALNAATNVDTIVGFSHRDDTIDLSLTIFTELTPGTLKSKFFHIGKKAADSDDHIIYNKKSGEIYYDHDGKGGDAQVLFAVLDPVMKDVSRNDFFVVA